MADRCEKWKKSASSTNESCVEIGYGPTAWGLRDSKDRAGGVLIVGRPAFEALLVAVKSGRLG